MRILAAGGNAIDTVMHHVQDGTALDFFGVHVAIPEAMVAIGITKLVIYQWIVAVFVVTFFVTVARKATSGVPTGMYNAVEALLVGLKVDIGDQLLGEKDSLKWMPYLWTCFFVIFFNNACGLLPMGATATGHLKVTMMFGGLTFVLMHVCAMSHGPKGYFHAIVPSVPLALWPLMLFLEQVGLVAKSMALMVRLFANMVAGHLIFLTVMAFIIMFGEIAFIIVVPAGVGLYLLEIFVAALQAYIYTFLSAVFIGAMLHPDH